MSAAVYTIGHSNHEIELFIGLLQAHAITAVGDVRSSPYSRYNPQFNRENLEKSLRQAGIAYRFLGQELGARSDDPSCYEGTKVQYVRLAQTAVFQRGIKRVLTGMEQFRLALMCAEKDPLDCHRFVLVSRQLVKDGIAVQHILPDGAVESHAEALERLSRQLDLPEEDLFRSHQEILEDAYTLQAERIAYDRAADSPGSAG